MGDEARCRAVEHAVDESVDHAAGGLRAALAGGPQEPPSYPDSPFAPEIAVMLYDEYSKAGDAEKVVRVAELAVRTEVLGQDTRFLGRYAAYLVEHDLRPDRAQELVRMAVTLAPDDPAVHDRAADVYQRLGKLERAIDVRKRAVETAGESERAKYGRRLKKLLETRGQ